MQTTLAQVVTGALFELRAISEEAASAKPAPGKWSKKEILGHLIDSAANNHQRFIRLMTARELSLPGYDQDAWVHGNDYQQKPWAQVIELWAAYNLHLAFVIERVSPVAAEHVWHHPAADYKLGYLVEDYVVHQLHHLHQMRVAK